MIMKRILSLMLTFMLAVSAMTSCTSVSEDLMKGISRSLDEEKLDDIQLASADVPAVTDFAVRLFKASAEEGKNTLVSPLSVLFALSMTANGADNETLEQMEAVLGMPVTQLNIWLQDYMAQLPATEKYKLSLANSVWINNDSRFSVEQDFLQTNADYYGADIYSLPFDNSACREINDWVKKKTDGMIENILEEISYEAVMYLVNALAFDAEWQDIYFEWQINKGEFTTESGDKREVEMMYGEENLYLEDENAVGFIKYYKDRKYAFVAFLPNEGTSVSEYISSLDGEKLNGLLENPLSNTVKTAIPKFESEYSAEMTDILKSMGIENAFDSSKADFTKLGSSDAGNIFISRVIHKTFIEVNERGTKAGAATVVEAADGAILEIEEPKYVYLDRPFVYMLIDCETKLPFFIGTMMDVEQ